MNIDAMELNSLTYLLVASTASETVTIPVTTGGEKVIIDNDSTITVFVVAGGTAAFPTDAGAGVAGKVVRGGVTQTYALPVGTTQISIIAASGTPSIYLTVGAGL